MVIQCIPIPLIVKFTSSSSLIIPILLPGNVEVRRIYRELNTYIQNALDDQGLHSMKKSTKLRLSDKNHKLYSCSDEEIFEILYL